MARDEADSSAPPDWSVLPEQFSYVSPLAERLGVIAGYDGHIRRKLTKKELQELKALAEQISLKNHSLFLSTWWFRNRDTFPLESSLTAGLLRLINNHELSTEDSGPKQQPEWTIEAWSTLDWREFFALVPDTIKWLPEAEAFALISRGLAQVPKSDLLREAVILLSDLRSELTLDWIEHNVPTVVSKDWGSLASVSRFSWSRAVEWFKRGSPLKLVALDALQSMNGKSEWPVVQKINPSLVDPPSFEEAERVLTGLSSSTPVPRVQRAVKSILESWGEITRPGKDSRRGSH
jgi:hypothetical protein